MRLLAILVAASLLVAVSTHSASTSFFAVDLGSEYLKISVIKPGRIPISIVLNESSKRKTPALVGFVDGHRFVGEEAIAVSGRHPDKVFSRLRDLLGRKSNDEELKDLFVAPKRPYEMEPIEERGTIAIKVSDSESYTVEELVASLLEYASRLAAIAAEEHHLTDCVLVVPAWFTPAQRLALLDAASIAGLNVMGLVHSHAAAALQYGIERDFTNKTENVLFYDLGAGSLEAALVTYSSYEGPDGKAISQFEVKDVAWVEQLGGENIEVLLEEHLAKQFTDGDVLASPRALAKLSKQIRRAKEVLSANSEVSVSVEELLNGQDFKGYLSRDSLEELAGDFWGRAVAPVLSLLERNNMTAQDLSAVEMLGGSSRIPKIKIALSEALGGRTLDMHLDADEAVVIGAGYFAANLSTVFRLRQFGMTDKVPYSVSFEILDSFETVGERTLVPAVKSKLPTRRAVVVQNITTPEISIRLTHDSRPGSILPSCHRALDLGTYVIQGIDEIVQKYGSSGKVSLHTKVTSNGVFEVEKADAAIELTEEIVVPPIRGNDTSVNMTHPINETVVEENAKMEWRTRTVKIPLNFTASSGLGPMKTTEKEISKKVLRKLRDADDARKETAKARNDLEAYVIASREDWLAVEDISGANDEDASSEFSGLHKVTSAGQRESILNRLNDVEEWLYGDEGDIANASEYRTKLREVRKDPDAAKMRAKELSSRPKAVRSAQEAAELVRKASNSWSEIKPWLNETEIQSFLAVVDELETWLSEKQAAQDALAPHETPAFSSAQVAMRVETLQKDFTRLNSKRPPKVPKPVLNDTEIHVDEAATPSIEEEEGVDKEPMNTGDDRQEGMTVEANSDTDKHDEL